MSAAEMMYRQLGISRKVYEYGEKIWEALSGRFRRLTGYQSIIRSRSLQPCRTRR